MPADYTSRRSAGRPGRACGGSGRRPPPRPGRRAVVKAEAGPDRRVPAGRVPPRAAGAWRQWPAASFPTPGDAVAPSPPLAARGKTPRRARTDQRWRGNGSDRPDSAISTAVRHVLGPNPAPAGCSTTSATDCWALGGAAAKAEAGPDRRVVPAGRVPPRAAGAWRQWPAAPLPHPCAGGGSEPRPVPKWSQTPPSTSPGRSAGCGAAVRSSRRSRSGAGRRRRGRGPRRAAG